ENQRELVGVRTSDSDARDPRDALARLDAGAGWDSRTDSFCNLNHFRGWVRARSNRTAFATTTRTDSSWTSMPTAIDVPAKSTPAINKNTVAVAIKAFWNNTARVRRAR